MSEQHSVKRIGNNTGRFIILPPTPSHPRGVTLNPGLNTVSQLYLDELDEVILESEERKENGRIIKATRYKPAENMWKQLQEHVRIVTAEGETFGPQVTIYEDVMSDRQDGLPPPLTLPNKKELAEILIKRTTERAALERWAKQGRGANAQLAAARLRELTDRVH
jgi:hypothetical protein